eukprot:1287883-Rhodomonas_salina.1
MASTTAVTAPAAPASSCTCRMQHCKRQGRMHAGIPIGIRMCYMLLRVSACNSTVASLHRKRQRVAARNGRAEEGKKK